MFVYYDNSVGVNYNTLITIYTVLQTYVHVHVWLNAITYDYNYTYMYM